MTHKHLIHTLLSLILTTVAASCRHIPTASSKLTPEQEQCIDSIKRLIYSDPQTAIATFDSIRPTCQDIAPDYINALSACVSIAHLYLGQPQKTDSMLRAARHYTDTHTKAHISRVRIPEIQGVIHSLYGRNDSAGIHFDNAYRQAMQCRLYTDAIRTISSKAEMQELCGNAPGAVQSFRRALFLADSTGIHTSDFNTRTRLATAYSNMGNFTEADRQFTANDTVTDTTPDDRFFFHSAQGNSNYFRHDYPNALALFKHALTDLDSISVPDPYYYAVTYANIAECFMLTDSLPQAHRNIHLADSIFKTLAVSDPGQNFYLNSLHGALALASGQTTKAQQLLTAYNPDTIAIPPRYAALHYHRLKDLYTAQGNWQKAMQSLQKAQLLDDSLRTLVNTQFADEINTRHIQETTLLSTQLKIASLDEKNFLLKMWIYGILAAVLLVTLIVVLIVHSRHSKVRRELADSRAKLTAARMEAARTRISPHFIFNLLNTALPPEQTERLSALIRLMRQNLILANAKVITLRHELDFINDYITAETPTLGKNFKYNLHLSPQINPDQVQIPSMMLQILVENAIKHSLQNTTATDQTLTISITTSGHDIAYRVSNPAVAANTPKPQSTGNGLRIMAQTIAMLNSVNQHKINFSQSVAESRLTTTLTIPTDCDFSQL